MLTVMKMMAMDGGRNIACVTTVQSGVSLNKNAFGGTREEECFWNLLQFSCMFVSVFSGTFITYTGKGMLTCSAVAQCTRLGCICTQKGPFVTVPSTWMVHYCGSSPTYSESEDENGKHGNCV